MKIRPLPDIDLARIAPMPRDTQRKQLEQLNSGVPPRLSYSPVRSLFHDILNIRPAMFGPSTPTAWRLIEQTLTRKCKAGNELEANLKVAKGLHRYATTHGITGARHEFLPLPMGIGGKVEFWHSMVLAFEGRALVPFIDPRRNKGLSSAGRRFAFSMMHERIRVGDPDFATVRLAIFRFGDPAGDVRHPVMHTDDGIELHSLDELEEMVTTTYELWQEVCEKRETDTRRRAGGMRGSLV